MVMVTGGNMADAAAAAAAADCWEGLEEKDEFVDYRGCYPTYPLWLL